MGVRAALLRVVRVCPCRTPEDARVLPGEGQRLATGGLARPGDDEARYPGRQGALDDLVPVAVELPVPQVHPDLDQLHARAPPATPGSPHASPRCSLVSTSHVSPDEG